MQISELIDKKNVITTVSNIAFDREYDVIVSGLGTAGAITLLSSAKKGLKVLGIEKLNCMGGSATAGGVASYYYGVNGGMCQTVDEKARKIQEKTMVAGGLFHPCSKKIALEQEIIAAGADVCYESIITGIYLEQKNVLGVKLFTPTGNINVKCKILVDGTADGEVCALAGCEFSFGRDSDGTTQPYTNIRAMVRDKNQQKTINLDAGYIDPTDGKAVSDAIIHGGRGHLREHFDENEKITFTAPLSGTREGRLITGEEVLYFDDFITGKCTSKPIFYEYSNHDTHSWDWAFESETVQKWLTVCGLWEQMFTVPVPMGTLLPKGYSGLMTVGRCISVDHDTAQSVRMQMAMQKSGEAAAIIADFAISNSVELKNVPYDKIKGELEKAGLLNTDGRKIPFALIKTAEELKERLLSQDPGLGIWSAYQSPETFEKYLLEWVGSNDENLSKHSALALGLAGSKTALPLLRKMVWERDMFLPKIGRKRVSPRICSAIYLLGELNDTEMIPEILSILGKNINFAVTTNALTALLKIGNHSPAFQKNIANGLIETLSAEKFTIELAYINESMTDYCRVMAAKQISGWGIRHSIDELIDKKNMTLRAKTLWAKANAKK